MTAGTVAPLVINRNAHAHPWSTLSSYSLHAGCSMHLQPQPRPQGPPMAAAPRPEPCPLSFGVARTRRAAPRGGSRSAEPSRIAVFSGGSGKLCLT